MSGSAARLRLVDEPRVAGIVAGLQRAADDAREVVEDHEVEVIADPLDDAGERTDLDDEAGLLADLAGDRLRERLRAVEAAAGHAPQPHARGPAPLDEQDAAVGVEHDRRDRADRRHRAPRGRGFDRGVGAAFAGRARASPNVHADGHRGARLQ